MSTEQNNGMKPAVPPKRSLLSDRRVRLLLSLLGAVIAWMAVTIVVQPGTTTTIYNVPVDFTYDSSAYTSRGLSIVNAEEKTAAPTSSKGFAVCILTPPSTSIKVFNPFARIISFRRAVLSIECSINFCPP